MSKKKYRMDKSNKNFNLETINAPNNTINESEQKSKAVKSIIKWFKKLPIPILGAFLSFVGLNLSSLFSNILIEKFNSGYLKAFGILSNIPIERITSHSKLMTFIFSIISLLFVSYIIYHTYMIYKDSKHAKIIFFILCFLVVFVYWFFLYLYILCLDNYYSIWIGIITLVTVKDIWLISFVTALFLTLYFFATHPSSHSSEHEVKTSKFSNLSIVKKPKYIMHNIVKKLKSFMNTIVKNLNFLRKIKIFFHDHIIFFTFF